MKCHGAVPVDLCGTRQWGSYKTGIALTGGDSAGSVITSMPSSTVKESVAAMIAGFKGDNPSVSCIRSHK